MKLVGEGMAKYYQKDDIKLLGVASWECGMFRESLVIYCVIILNLMHYIRYIFFVKESNQIRNENTRYVEVVFYLDFLM